MENSLRLSRIYPSEIRKTFYGTGYIEVEDNATEVEDEVLDGSVHE